MIGDVSGRKPRLLFLCHTLPYPLDAGVWIRTYHVLRLLARAFDITALCFERAASGSGVDVAASRDALSRFGSVEVFPIPQKHSRVRYVWDHVRSAAFRQVYTTYMYDSRRFHRRLTELLATDSFDLVHVDNLDLARYLHGCRDVPVVCVHHNVESILLRRRAGIERGAWRRAYLRYQACLMEAVERRWAAEVPLNVTVSERDGVLLRHLAPTARVAVVPNGVDIDEFRGDGTAGSGVAFVGGANWFPNVDALDFFCHDIQPHLRAVGDRFPVRWIGSASSEQQRRYGERYGVEMTGYVDDVRPFMRQAACHIVPLRAGGGTRLKILNSWAMGKPVVSTSVGCEGLATRDGENILIRDDPEDFAAAIRAVLGNADLRRRLGDAGRATAERHYSWEVIGRELVDIYLQVARETSRKSSFAHTFGRTAAHQAGA